MKLSMDCVRAVMLCVEEHTDFDHYCYFIRYARADILDMLFLGNLEKLRLHGGRSGIIFAADVFLLSDIKAAAHTHYVLLPVNVQFAE